MVSHERVFISDGISRKSVFFRRYLTKKCLFLMVSHERVFVSDGISRKSVCFRWYLTEECLFQMVSHERVFVSDGISRKSVCFRWYLTKECLFQMVSYERGNDDGSCRSEACDVETSEEAKAQLERGEEKLSTLQLEYTHLLSSQLETQRQYFEDRMAELAASASAEVGAIIAFSSQYLGIVKYSPPHSRLVNVSVALVAIFEYRTVNEGVTFAKVLPTTTSVLSLSHWKELLSFFL